MSFIIGSDSNDTLRGTDTNDEITGGLGDDLILAAAGNDLVFGSSGNDTLRGGNDNDSLFGDAGNDNLNGATGSDALDGGDGIDTVESERDENMILTDGQLIFSSTSTGSASPNISIPDRGTISSELTLVSPDTRGITDIDVKINIDHSYDGDLDIFLIGPNGARVELSTHNGGSTNNYTNTVFDDDASFSITSGSAPFTGRFRPEGDLNAFNGLDANGVWTLEVTDTAGGDLGTLVDWSLVTSTQADVDSLTSIENAKITGGNGNNNFNASSFTGTTNLDGGLGDDTINGGLGNDVLNGGSGNDRVIGGEGNDRIVGVSGDDKLSGGAGVDTLFGGTGGDSIEGGFANDLLFGGNGLDSLNGGIGDDNLDGAAGNDFMVGGEGNDTFVGAASLTSGTNEIDDFVGGLGADRFVLGVPGHIFYDDGSNITRGDADYALISNFYPSSGDRLQLQGSANDYFLGSASNVAAGSALFYDTDNNGALNSSDELIAIVSGPGALSVSNTIAKAAFV